MISALAPALCARSTSPTIRSRVPSQYIWKNVCGFSVTTSSIGLLANELSPIAVPARAAARATATSPAGWTPCAPVGDITTGNEISSPTTEVASPRGPPSPVATFGTKASSRKAATFSSTVIPCSSPASSAA